MCTSYSNCSSIVGYAIHDKCLESCKGKQPLLYYLLSISACFFSLFRVFLLILAACWFDGVLWLFTLVLHCSKRA